MTITVTKEELANYKGQLTSWCIRRLEYLNELKKTSSKIDDKTATIVKVDAVAEMNKWEEENPAPRLVEI